MNWLFTVGRILLVAFFVVSGVQMLLDYTATADVIQSKLTIPEAFLDVANQIETAVGMSKWRLLAIFLGVIEAAAGLLIACNILTRTAAVVLLFFPAATIYYFHDFWTTTGPDQKANLYAALMNLSIIGALLMLAAWPRRGSVAEASERHEHL
jgi:putative oxidoreductase